MTRFFLLFFYCSNCIAQSYPLQKGSVVQSLKAQGADTILLFSIKTMGRSIPQIEDSVYACFDVDYMLWKLNGKTWLQKLAACYDTGGDGASYTALESLPLYMDSSIIHDYLSTHLDSIMNSHIFPCILKGAYKGREFYYASSATHQTIYFIALFLKDGPF